MALFGDLAERVKAKESGKPYVPTSQKAPTKSKVLFGDLAERLKTKTVETTPTQVAQPQIGTFQPSMLRKDYKAPVQLPQAQISAIDPNNRPIPAKPQTIATPPKLKSGLGDLARSTVATTATQIMDAVKFAKDVAMKPPKILGQGVADFAKKANAPLSNFVDKYAGKAKEYAEAVNQSSPEYEKATLKEKVTKYLPETAKQLGVGVVGSLIPYAINPVLGLATSIGSTAEDVKQKAKEAGMDDDRADTLALTTGVAVGMLDRIIPSKVFGKEKGKFLTKFVSNWVKTPLTEGGTEVAQEGIQLLAEKTFRDDLGWDEAKTRTAMAGLGGLFGGAGMHGVSNLINTATRPTEQATPTDEGTVLPPDSGTPPPTATPPVVAQEAISTQEVVSTRKAKPKQSVDEYIASKESKLRVKTLENTFEGKQKTATISKEDVNAIDEFSSIVRSGKEVSKEEYGRMVDLGLSYGIEDTKDTPRGLANALQKALETREDLSNKPKFRIDPSNADPLISEAKKYKSAEEFVQNNYRGENPNEPYIDRNIKALKEAGFNVSSKDDLVTLYHGTNKKGYLGIEKTGFNSGSYFATDRKAAEGFVGKDGKVLEVKVPVSELGFVKAEQMAGTKGVIIQSISPLEIGKNGIYKSPDNYYKTKSQLTDIWNKAHGQKFRLKDDLANKGIEVTDEQEAQIIKLNQELFGDSDVKITGQIIANKEALGKYQAGMIEILSGQADAKATMYHEAVHKYLDVFTDRQEQSDILTEAQSKYGLEDLGEVEERVAEDFIYYAKTHEGVVGKMKLLFDRVLNRIDAFVGKETGIDSLYADIMSGKAKKTTSSTNSSTDSVFKRLQEENPDILTGEMSHEVQNLKENADKAVELIKKDKNKAYRIALGIEEPPSGQTSTAVNIALAQKALEDGNNTLYAELTRNRSLAQVRRGQEIVAEKGSVTDNSTSRYVKELIKSRLETLSKSYLSDIKKGRNKTKKATDIIDTEVVKLKDRIKKTKEMDLSEAQSFLDSLACK